MEIKYRMCDIMKHLEMYRLMTPDDAKYSVKYSVALQYMFYVIYM